MNRRPASLLVAVVLAAVALPANASPATPERDPHWVRKYTFRAQGSGRLEVTGAVTTTRKGVFGSVLYISAAGSHAVASTLNDFDSQLDGPRAYGVRPPVDHCGLGISCTISTSPGRLDFSYTAEINQREQERIYSIDLYLFGQGRLVQLHEELDLWRRTGARQGGLTIIDTTETTSIGVSGAGYNAEAFSSVSSSSRKPSFAVAPLSCGSAGVGLVSLDGGEVSDMTICPTGQKVLEGRSLVPTTWVVTGPAAGTSVRSTRLAVIEMQ